MQKRRRYYLPGTDQPGLLRTLVGIWLLTTVVSALLFYFGANRSLEEATYRAHFESLRETSQVFLPYLLAGNLVAAFAVLLLAIFYTHRVAGPIYQIERRLASVRDGDLRVSFAVRKGDRFHSLADALNDATAALRARLAHARGAVDRLEEAGKGAGAAGVAEYDSALRDLRRALEEMRI